MSHVLLQQTEHVFGKNGFMPIIPDLKINSTTFLFFFDIYLFIYLFSKLRVPCELFYILTVLWASQFPHNVLQVIFNFQQI